MKSMKLPTRDGSRRLKSREDRSYETYQLDVERAEKAPATRNDILAKRFGIPMEGSRTSSRTTKPFLTRSESSGDALRARC